MNLILIADSNNTRRNALAKAFSSTGTTVYACVNQSLVPNQPPNKNSNTSDPPLQFDLALKHIGDENFGYKSSSSLVIYYGGNGPNDPRFWGGGPRSSEPCKPATWIKHAEDMKKLGGIQITVIEGYLLKRKIDQDSDTVDFCQSDADELLRWVEARKGKGITPELPACLKPPPAEPTILPALAILCQGCLIAHASPNGFLDSVESAQMPQAIPDETRAACNKALGKLGWQSFSEVPANLALLPSDVSTRRAQTRKPDWWATPFGGGGTPGALAAELDASEAADKVRALANSIWNGEKLAEQDLDLECVANAYEGLVEILSTKRPGP